MHDLLDAIGADNPKVSLQDTNKEEKRMLYNKLVSDIFAEGCLIDWEVGNVRCLYVPHTGKRYRVTYNGHRVANLECQKMLNNTWIWEKV